MNRKSLHTADKSNKQKSKLNDGKDFASSCITTMKLWLQFIISLPKDTLVLFVRYSALFAGCCLCFIGFFISGCENDVKKIRELTENKVTKEEAINIESFLSQAGKMKAKLTAPLMIRVAADTVYAEFPNTLHVDFYNDSTKIETRLDSKYGKYFETSNKVYLRDSVVVINVKGDTLKSPDLWWDKNTGLFYTDKYAIYHGTGKDIYGGKGLVATQDLASIIFNQPTGTVQVSDNGFPK
jgi:LPS export ABC transporter protein LptC